ncbi:phage tail protein [Erythrobacter sp. THAF29]|uniref:phage tail protein n=1 Tax=Erythrobacter sp. THAF29 TaxID=2587851 RepID=UPI0012682E71|nr:phage tail protein [Erythrobacter sp. THAF29]QFT76051.1 T4-like virus tail tube protein gp19 [Erythrobacter sp. THAF29]
MPEDTSPYRNFNFTLQIQDIEAAHFTECLGLGVRVHPIKYRESGAGQIVRALTGPVEYAEVILRYGVTTSTDMWQWLVASMRGTAQRRNVSLIMLQEDGATEGDRWNLANAWPCEWRGPVLETMGREAAIEEMRLVFDQLERA